MVPRSAAVLSHVVHRRQAIALFAGAGAAVRANRSPAFLLAIHEDALPSEYPDFGLTPEQRHEAVFGHYYEWPGMDGEHGEIWAYTPRFSYRPGDTVTVHVSSTARSFQL